MHATAWGVRDQQGGLEASDHGVKVISRLGGHSRPQLQEKVIAAKRARPSVRITRRGVQFMAAKKIAPPTKSTWSKTNTSEAGRNLVNAPSWATLLEALGSIFSSSSLRGDRPTKLNEGHGGS